MTDNIKTFGKIITSTFLGCFFLHTLTIIIRKMIEELISTEVSYSEATRKALLCYLAIACIYCMVTCFKYAYEHLKNSKEATDDNK